MDGVRRPKFEPPAELAVARRAFRAAPNGMSLDEHDLRMLLIWYLNWPEASRREPPLGDKMVDAIELGWNAGTSGRTLSAAINDARQIFAPDTESSKAQAKK